MVAMTGLATMTSSRAGEEPKVPRPVLLGAALAAGASALGGALVCSALAVTGWIAGDGGSVPGALRVGIDAWLLGHKAPMAVPGGSIGMAPLGLTLLFAVVSWRAGQWMTRTCAVYRIRDAVTAMVGFTGTYGGIGLLLALVGRAGDWGPAPGSALLACAAVAFVGGGAGVVQASGLGSRAWARFPEEARAALVGGLAGLLALLAGGSLVLVGSLALHGSRMVSLGGSLGAGMVGGVLVTLACLAYVPNAVILTVSYVSGPGFVLGTGTTVTLTDVQLGRLPAFPLLAGLPGEGVPPAPVLGLMIVPLAAGAVAGVVAVRRYPVFGPDLSALRGALAGVAGGIGIGALAAISGGSIGPGRLGQAGPLWWQVGLTCLVSMAIAGAGAALILHLRAVRSSTGS